VLRFQPFSAFALLVLVALCGCSDDGASPRQPATAAGAANGGSVGTASAGSATGGSGGAAGSASAGATTVGGAGATAGRGGAGESAGTGGSAGGGSGGSGGSGGATEPTADYQLYGRWDVTHPGKAITVNGGSHLTASFNGSGISAKFDMSGNTGVPPTVSFRIDDGDVVEKEITPMLELAKGLPVAEHRVLLFVRGMSEFDARWTPPLVSSTVFLGFEVAGGALVPKPRPQRTKIEFLGDSITEGVAVHTQGPAGQTTPNWRSDGARNYASLAAQKLGFEWRQVGFGRQGLTVGGNGGVPKAQDAFNFIYAGVARDAWQPDIVVINQGTNDRATAGKDFAPLYDTFLGIVRTAYPNAKIAALRPLVGDFGTEIQAQVKARKTAGDSKIFYVDTGGWTAPADFTDGIHPNESGSVKIADKLVAALQALPH
jgi:lysophospholipase L1-like esterase